MSKSSTQPQPPDQQERIRALNPLHSVLVQAPAGSGKTDLLTRRFLALLAQVQDPEQIFAITFTKAAAAEMRHRILEKLQNAADEIASSTAPAPDTDAYSMGSLARRALLHSQALNWNLLDQPAQLRISTIDSFCREIALQQPLLSGLGDGIGIYEQPEDLYRRAARQTLQQIDGSDPTLAAAIERLLLWRDNNWQELETQLVDMLRNRDRWMQEFVLARDAAREEDWDHLRHSLEQSFHRAIAQSLGTLGRLFDQVPGSREEAHKLARFACQNGASALFQPLAELADFPADPDTADPALYDLGALEEARQAYLCLGELLLTQSGTFRKQVTKANGFPPDRKQEKAQILDLIARLSAVPGLDSALAAVGSLPPTRYSDDDWQIVRASFTLLRRAAAELHVVFAETGAVDYTQVAQTALGVLQSPDGQPTDAALTVADGIHHLLVDEFQDTSRRQHALLRSLIAAWPQPEGRSCFVVGDPMQSIYFFRDADAELFPRVKAVGLEIPGAEPLLFESIALTSNFRTSAPLVETLNQSFKQIFAIDDGSGIQFAAADPARVQSTASPVSAPQPFKLHLNFQPQTKRFMSDDADEIDESEDLKAAQIEEIVELIRSQSAQIEQARAAKEKYRVAVLGRTRNALAPIALALRQAGIPFRAVDLEQLSSRPEVLDALALARAVLNPLDRVAWLGVLRAPWCGLSLADLHTLTSADSPDLLARPIPQLLAERLPLLTADGQLAATRLLEAIQLAPAIRFSLPARSLGTWLEQLWLALAGDACADATARANLNLLWQSLDLLPNGEQDLLGPALDETLAKLTAQPDPEADANTGVQLMTIHKSKGLEFEIVIVPELQARTRQGKFNMLSWLERGLLPDEIENAPDGSRQITEFLVAPLQSKGAERSRARVWVDRVYRDREAQETRRLLYVAATRAREELHIFARPACKRDKDGNWTLAGPVASLLKTAWPALEPEIRRQFDQWRETQAQSASGQEPEADSATIESLAASADLFVMPSPIQPTQIRRLPPDYRPSSPPQVHAQTSGAPGLASETWEEMLYTRHEGGLISRALGTAVHVLFQQLARLRATSDWPAARAALRQFEPRIAAEIRAAGVAPAQAQTLAAEALRLALAASSEPNGQWILSPHADDASEARWVGVLSGSLRSVQVDRVFRAGPTPLSEGSTVWWIVDYKTAQAENPDPTASLPQLRATFAPQLEAYAHVLRNLHGADAQLRTALYYPRLQLLDWWEP
jgi:ATP-dependent exoDNAse (exonuclease V) beta subunit